MIHVGCSGAPAGHRNPNRGSPFLAGAGEPAHSPVAHPLRQRLGAPIPVSPTYSEQHLVQMDVVEDLDLGVLGQPCRHAGRVVAAPLDHRG